MNTKNCPYCGKEILAVAKKCRYCGKWLENPTGSIPNEKASADNDMCKEKKVVPYYIPLALFAIFVIWVFVAMNKSDRPQSQEPAQPTYSYNNYKNNSVSQSPVSEVATEKEEKADDNAAKVRYQAKYEDVYSADIHLMRADGKKIWYSPWTSNSESGYINKMYVYDSESDRETTINLNKTSLDDEMMFVEDMVEHNGVITIIMTEMRNSNGWLEGTHVWQYNCNSESWKCIASECSGAEFTNNRNSVEIDYAECINPDEPTFMQEYRHNYKTIKL